MGKTVAQVPGQLRTREIRLGLVRIDREGLLDFEERLLFEVGVGGLVEKLLRVRAGERGARQREVAIKSHCLFELLDGRQPLIAPIGHVRRGG